MSAYGLRGATNATSRAHPNCFRLPYTSHEQVQIVCTIALVGSGTLTSARLITSHVFSSVLLIKTQELCQVLVPVFPLGHSQDTYFIGSHTNEALWHNHQQSNRTCPPHFSPQRHPTFYKRRLISRRRSRSFPGNAAMPVARCLIARDTTMPD